MKRVVGLDAESVSHAERLRMRLISASQEDGVSPTQFFELLEATVKEKAWEELGISFVELVKEPPPIGMGLAEHEFRTLLTLKHRYEDKDQSVRDRMKSVRRYVDDELDPALFEHGANQHVGDYNIKSSPRSGTSETYTLRRLKRDRPDLAEKVMNKELSANAAAVEAGFRPRMLSISLSCPESAFKSIMGNASQAYISTLASLFEERT